MNILINDSIKQSGLFIVFKIILKFISFFQYLPNKLKINILNQILRKLPKRYLIVNNNLEKCFPDMSADDLQHLYHQNLLETCHGLTSLYEIFYTPINKWKKKVKITNYHLSNLSNKPLIILTPHFTNLERIGKILHHKININNQLGYIARPFNNTLVADFFKKARQCTCFYPKQGIEIFKHLKNNNILFMLPDQFMKGKASTEVDFLGIKTLGITSPVQLAMKTGANIIIAHLDENETCNELIFSDPLNKEFTNDVQKNTQIIFNHFSNLILQDPKKYLWLHDRFKHYHSSHAPKT